VFLILRPHVKELVNNTLVGNWELLKLSIEYQLLIINGVVVTAVKKTQITYNKLPESPFFPEFDILALPVRQISYSIWMLVLPIVFWNFPPYGYHDLRATQPQTQRRSV
jgi:hypothetical protein